ncbi:hypothetical protein scyTo_0022001 [Scyliorhinus torazame]|uniref:SEA domain-containing protein n=1 Tax=Scyliorhinus torazame TaxID=75743 RepID=A0A401QAP8_SCYTO|nr:hypothetical protein [Scyliorhinus torazame]
MIASDEYKNLAAEITEVLVPAARNRLNDSAFNIIIVGFQNGSVLVNLLLLLNNTSNITADTLESVIADAIKSVDNQSSVTVTGAALVTTPAPTTPQTVLTGQTPSDNSGFKVAVIVLGVILGVALLVILAIVLTMVCMMKKSGRYFISGSDMLQRFSYKYI